VGNVKRDRTARIALVNQHHADQIDMTLSPLQFMLKEYPGAGNYAQEQVACALTPR
jgi:ATP-binding cassette subfamily F protein 3